VIDRYNAGCFYLKDVARGLVNLDIVEDDSAAIAYSQPTQIFTRMVW